MRFTAERTKAALPYLCLASALILCGWAFVRSEQYRAESDLNYSQTYEVQWRTTQIREHLARIHGDLRLAAATGQMQADLQRQVFLLNANVNQLLKLEYAPKFLGDHDVRLLRGLQAVARDFLGPIVEGSTEFQRALQVMPDLEQRMFEVSGTAVAHAETLNAASRIAASASRNRFLFAVALVLAAVGYTIIHLRNAFARRQDQHLRSFSSLYAHMTRSRVAALNLFLSYQDRESVNEPEMLAAAKDAAQQLEAITNALGTIAYAHKDTQRDRLLTILQLIGASQASKLELCVCPEAAEVMVPATQIRLIVEELVRNAEAALVGEPEGGIKISAQVKRRMFRRRHQLVLQIDDNGQGMSPDVLARAKNPFFSTKAGSHTGLGLTGCSHMVTALNGRLTITSQPGKGTAIQIAVPI
jgi:signal transduction histidine kinase